MENENNYISKEQKYFDEFVPQLGFKVADDFLIARGKTVFVKKDDRREQMTKMGIIIPESNSIKPSFDPSGVVYSVGPEVKWLKPGMRVVYNMYANLEIYHEGITYISMGDFDVKACIPFDAVVTTEKKAVEKRPEIRHEDMPDIAQNQEEIKMQQEEAKEVAELIKKDVTTKHFAVDGTKE